MKHAMARSATKPSRTSACAPRARLALNQADLEAAKAQRDAGTVTPHFGPWREDIIGLLNDALATEWVCVLRYKRHHFTATGLAAPDDRPDRRQGPDHAPPARVHSRTRAAPRRRARRLARRMTGRITPHHSRPKRRRQRRDRHSKARCLFFSQTAPFGFSAAWPASPLCAFP